ncbi:MAG: DUF2249 domain-containing protein [Deltaproteobacteria bacterium]|nr:DUF2249 domain-containing protein [Deltaproteobacteria bacterium]
MSPKWGESARLRQLDLRSTGDLDQLRAAIARLSDDELLEVVLPPGLHPALELSVPTRGHGELELLLVAKAALPPVLELIGLEPPEPLERILEALARLPRGGSLLAELPRVPWPLFKVLSEQGASSEHLERPDGSCLVCMTK